VGQPRFVVSLVTVAAAAVIALAAADRGAAPAKADDRAAASIRSADKIIPGRTTKAEVKAILGEPWRVVQFNDCGMAMDDQADETWEYRGADPDTYRLHIEFDDAGIVHLVAQIPDATPGGRAVAAKSTRSAAAKSAPAQATKGMSM
jgi:hypothetical protein